ncbi:ribosomal protein L19E [Paenibacillus phyllosphaerae]|uniref:Ribosomal protein L19E n=1 Tax=Paenibacillus phyllosphaerae TaxID=274593 RepID=A0A7W5FP45_9BACL|nr:ribosomal protein L19E [Paenibacillus phyllosphaerae]
MNAEGLTTPKENVQQLQEKLGHAAKETRSHALYDKVSQGIFCGKHGGECARTKAQQVWMNRPLRTLRGKVNFSS